MRTLAIVLLSLGVVGGYGSALAHLRHGYRGHGECGAWSRYHERAPSAALGPAAAAPAPAPQPPSSPQIIIVQPQPAPAAAPTVVVQQPPTAETRAPAPPAE